MNDHDLLLAIEDLMDGVEWTPETLEEIADLLNENGYQVRDLDGSSSTPCRERRGRAQKKSEKIA